MLDVFSAPSLTPSLGAVVDRKLEAVSIGERVPEVAGACRKGKREDAVEVFEMTGVQRVRVRLGEMTADTVPLGTAERCVKNNLRVIYEAGCRRET